VRPKKPFPEFSVPPYNDRVQREPLSELRVVNSCPASWTRMQGTARVRHCEQCDLNVYNISELSRAEAVELVRETEGRVCARYYQRRDGTIMTRDCPATERAGAKAKTALAAALGLVGISMTTGCIMGSTGSAYPETQEIVTHHKSGKSHHVSANEESISPPKR